VFNDHRSWWDGKKKFIYEVPFALGTSPFHITSSLIYNPFDNPNTTFYGGEENDE